MRSKTRDAWKSVDWFTILLYILMIVAGWLSICGASYEFGSAELLGTTGRPATQLMWMGISLCVAFSILMIERDFFEVFAYLIYAGILLLLVQSRVLIVLLSLHLMLSLEPMRILKRTRSIR